MRLQNMRCAQLVDCSILVASTWWIWCASLYPAMVHVWVDMYTPSYRCTHLASGCNVDLKAIALQLQWS